MTNLTITFILFYLTIFNVINTSHSTGIISKFLPHNNPLARSLYHDQQQPQYNLPDQYQNQNNALFHIDKNVILKTNDLLTCKVLKGNDEKSTPEFKVNTPPLTGNTIFYTYLLVPRDETCFSIKIRAEKYAYLALSENPYKGGRMFDIILGISGPIMQSSIRKNLAEEVVKIPTPDIINGKDFREFVISWKDGKIMIMRGNELTPFLFYQEPNMYPVNYIGIATFGKPGTWIVGGTGCSQIDKPTIDLENFVTECWPQQTKTNEINSQFNNLIQLQKYYLNQMTNNYEYFNKSVQQQKDKEFIEIYKNELKENYKKANEIHTEIILSQIKNDNKEQLNSYNKQAEEMFGNIRQLFYKYYGNLQILLNNLNKFDNFDSECNAKKPNHESENMKLISADEFYQITTNGCFTFKVHRSAGYIRITLTDGYKKSLKAQIIIGKNSEIQTWKNFMNFENHKLSTPKFEQRAEYQIYWLSWNAQRILVGRDGDIEGFINTNKAIDFTDLKYVNVLTENEDDKQWEIEESKCPHDIDIRIDD